MVPEAWHNDNTMSQEKRDFYRWSACVMEVCLALIKYQSSNN